MIALISNTLLQTYDLYMELIDFREKSCLYNTLYCIDVTLNHTHRFVWLIGPYLGLIEH